eukprot:CAMPEP_0204519376 /NCGR_PEP_ID=MMETSP0661-20131031/4703_1 /ASSEMBLY_ACC=CAM_ASM_000606 /TAXON_ID=109239 /ORGANISM="Alexandrium margalefi, Strain AMGDE01CS-322" /LENGTH=45 /DNA_ID= /DNA_START= /DNA_END= /DNA_ORIENTATION=
MMRRDGPQNLMVKLVEEALTQRPSRKSARVSPLSQSYSAIDAERA